MLEKNSERYSYIFMKKNLYNKMTKHLEKILHFNDYILEYSENTSINYYSTKEVEVVILGYCIDGNKGFLYNKEVARNLVQFSNNIDDIIKRSEKFTGRYLIITRIKNYIYVFPDATASIQSNYFFRNSVEIISSSKKVIDNNFKLNNYFARLLPNHYLRLDLEQPIRYWPVNNEFVKIELNHAIKLSNEYLNNIVERLVNDFDIAIPLTGGLDSRVVASLFMKYKNNVRFYTIKHDSYTDETYDIKIPQRISSDLELVYDRIIDFKPGEDTIANFLNKLPAGFKRFHLFNAFSFYKSHLKNHTHISGEILPIAKRSKSGALPEWILSQNFLFSKIREKAYKNREQFHTWYKKFKNIKSGYSIGDIFIQEYIEGMRNADIILIENQLNNFINIFNSTYIIKIWMRVNKRDRVKKRIHNGIIRTNYPGLLNYPVNPDKKIIDFIQSHSLLFYLATILYNLVQYLERFIKNRKRC